MTLAKYNNGALSPVFRDEFLTSVDSMFDKLFKDSFPSFSRELGDGFFSKGSYPKVDVVDCPKHIEIEAEIPGLSKEEVSVELQENVLTISGEKQRKVKKESEDSGTYLYRELKHSSFKRSFTLGDNIDTENIVADFKDGILNVKLNKLAPTEPKKVKIL
jgi:HSP20 family protein